MAALLLRGARQPLLRCKLCTACDDAQAWVRGLSWSSAGRSGEAGQGSGVETGTISIDRSGLIQPQMHSHNVLAHKEPETHMARHLKAMIQVRLSLGQLL